MRKLAVAFLTLAVGGCLANTDAQYKRYNSYQEVVAECQRRGQLTPQQLAAEARGKQINNAFGSQSMPVGVVNEDITLCKAGPNATVVPRYGPEHYSTPTN